MYNNVVGKLVINKLGDTTWAYAYRTLVSETGEKQVSRTLFGLTFVGEACIAKARQLKKNQPILLYEARFFQDPPVLDNNGKPMSYFPLEVCYFEEEPVISDADIKAGNWPNCNIQITILGNLGSDPEMRYTPNGKAVTNFSIATNRTFTDTEGQSVKVTTWFRASAWERTAEICSEYLKKGQPVFCVARVNQDVTTGQPKVFDRKDGTKGSKLEINISQVRLLGDRTSNSHQSQSSTSEPQGAPDEEETEIPF